MMSKTSVNCILKSLDDPTNTIVLPNNTPVHIGRNQETCICDPMVSRKQITATADYKNNTVLIQTNGTNFSGCNGFALRKDGTYHVKHEDCIELLIGRHIFEVLFQPSSELEESEDLDAPVFKKKKANYSVFNQAKPSPKNTTKNIIQERSLWEKIDNGQLLVYTSAGVEPQTKIAAFDLDSTLIKTKSGLKFAKDAKDWTLNFSNVTNTLKDLHLDKYKIVVFSNQGGIGVDASKIAQFETKIEDIVQHINTPMQVFVATTKSIYRKPAPGMWHALCDEKNEGVPIDITKSFFVGDAAGRAKNWAPKKNKDHSVGDRLFALNLNLKFYTPEEYFFKSTPVPFTLPKFDPRLLTSGKVFVRNTTEQEVALMVGSPASGKTFFSRKHFPSKTYVYVSRDLLGTWQQCVKLLEKSLKNKQNVVVDNTNPDKLIRKKYIDVAKANKVPIRCFLMTPNLEHCKHNNRFRSLTDKTHTVVGDMVLNMHYKQFQEPTIDEGFTEIIKVDFFPDFDNAKHEKLYKMFLLES